MIKFFVNLGTDFYQVLMRFGLCTLNVDFCHWLNVVDCLYAHIDEGLLLDFEGFTLNEVGDEKFEFAFLASRLLFENFMSDLSQSKDQI